MENNKNYYNQIVYESFHSLCIKEFIKEEVKQNDNYQGKLQTISYQDALKSYFENGLSINHYLIDKERYEGIPVTMIEDITIAASNSHALLIAYENISANFFQSLPYKEKKSIVNHLVGKSFFSNGDIEYLLKTLYGKGFFIEQEKIESLEIYWIENQNIDALFTLFEKQQQFNFDFQYSYKGKDIDFTSIIELEISKEKSQQEVGYEIRIKNLESILDRANTLILFQMVNDSTADVDSLEDEDDSPFKI